MKRRNQIQHEDSNSRFILPHSENSPTQCFEEIF